MNARRCQLLNQLPPKLQKPMLLLQKPLEMSDHEKLGGQVCNRIEDRGLFCQ